MRRLIAILCLIAAPLWAVEPNEILDDPALEARAREISQGLRCPVCQNESIDESHAPVARDLRLLVRERLVAGDTDMAVMRYITDRYGEFVLLRPNTRGANLLLWLAGPLLLLIGLFLGFRMVRGRAKAAVSEALSEDEQARLDEIMRL